MVKLGPLMLAVAVSVMSVHGACAQAPRHLKRLPADPRAEAPQPRQSHFYIEGPNAPFQNQLRKLTDPLNANGAK